MTPAQALEFVEKHGVVLESGRGPIVSLAEAIAGKPIRGSWWSHPRGREIFAATRAVRDSKDICVCRLIDGKITFIHRRLWPALVCLSPRLSRDRLAVVRETHTASGRHELHKLAYPKWVTAQVTNRANRLTEAQAVEMIGDWIREQFVQKETRSP